MTQKAQQGLAENVDRRPEIPAPPAPRAPRTAVVVTRRAALGSAWLATVTLAAVAGWFAARLVAPPGGHRAAPQPVARVDPPPVVEVTPPVEEPTAPPEPVAEKVEAVETPAVEPAPQRPPPQAPAPSETASVPETVPVEPLPEPLVIEAPAPAIDERYERVAGLAESGDYEGARTEAETLLADYGDYSGLTEAFRDSGAGETRARLDALRVIQLGGLEEIGIELARELKRSYAGTPEVLEALREWRILKPNIASLDSSIVNGVEVVVSGQVANPDLGAVRQVIVEVEALDAGGNVLATTTARVRPRSLDPGEAGSFTARFDEIDPASVLSTRATVVKWQSEVIE